MILKTNHRWRSTFTLLLIIFLCTCGRAQDIQLTVMVPNPAPVYWEAYLEFQADIRVVITNVGTELRALKLVPTLSSDRGLSAAFRPTYRPLAPLTIGPGETLNLSYRELNALFGSPTQDDILLEGISFDRLFASETIPEGSYSLCVEAREFATDELLSNNFGCDLFFVRQHEPPLIIWPFDGEELLPLEPQFLNFLWSASGVPGQTRYRFALYDLEELGLFNRADAFVLGSVRPLYEADNLVATNLTYDLALPPLTVGRRYAVQVTAYAPDGGLLFAQGGQSRVHQFVYGGELTVVDDGNDFVAINPNNDPPGGPNEFQTQTPGNQLAMEACPEQLPANQAPSPTTLTAGQTIKVAGFDLVLASGGPTPLAGTGRVLVESLNTYVNVSFTGLRVNQNNEVVGDEVSIEAVAAGSPDLDNLSEAAGLQLAELVDANDRWLDPEGGSPGPAIDLPAGIAGAGMDLIITGMRFGPGSATLDVFAKIELPETQEEHRLLLVGKNACLNDQNLGANMELGLAEDASFPLEAGVTMTFAGGEEGTRLRWNANGIDELDVDLRLAFAPEVMPAGSPFAARVTATVTDYHDWIGTVELDPGNPEPGPMSQLSFDYGKVAMVYDHSSFDNPGGFTLPASHPYADQPSAWQGLYLANFDVIFPEGFEVTVAADDLLIDRFGVWTEIDISGNLLDIGEGSLGGWELGIDGLSVDVLGSALHNPSFDGRIRLPLGETEVAFTAPLDEDEDFSFVLAIGQELEVDMWIAKALLADNSEVGFTKTGDGFVPEAELHGQISLGWDGNNEEEDLAVSNFSLPGLDFQDFIVRGGPNPSVAGTFGLDLESMEQGSMQDFPLQLSAVQLELAPNNIDIGLQLDIGLKLSGNEANGFDGNTIFTIWGQRDDGQYRYDRTQFNGVSINAELNLISLSGELQLFDGDATFGNGFAANVSMSINSIGAGFDCRLQVGRAPGGFRYFMTDALLMLPDPGIQLGSTPLAIYGFGGGVWRNMERESNIGQFITYDPGDLAPQVSGNDDPGSSATFTPSQGTTGFSMTLVTGLSGSQRAVNADLEFTMTIGDDFSVDEITLGGGVYVVQAMDDRGDAFISGTGELKLDFDDQIFTLTVDGGMDFSLPKAIDVDVHAPLYAGFATGGGVDWWFYLGRWTDGVDPIYDDQRVEIKTGIDLGIASIESTQNLYFVMGNVWPDGEPGVPPIVSAQFQEDGKSVPTLNLPPNATTTGFAFGMARSMDLDFDVRIFKLEVGWLWGFDLALRDLSGVCGATDFGINGWYADGKAYAHMHVAGSVQGRLFGKTRKFKFVELDAAARLDFAGPNPIWIKGTARIHGRALGKLIKFDTNVSFEFGEVYDCRDGGNNIFDEIPIVEELDPDDGATGRSIFTAPQASFNFPNRPFAIEEDNGTVNHYGYRKIYCKISTRKSNNQGWTVLHQDLEGSYDQEGYAAYFDPDILPAEHWVKVELRVQGLRYKTDDADDGVDEYFLPMQDEVIEFRTGPAPDRLLRGSISNTTPFRRQLYFTPGDHATGRIDFGTAQAPGIFRNRPNDSDKLDPAGRFEYVVRFTSVASGISRDAPVLTKSRTNGVTFSMPPSGFAPETVYEADLLRLYYPPAGTEENNTEVSLVELKMYTPPELGYEAITPGGNNDDDGNGGGSLQLTFVNLDQQNSPPGGNNGYQFANLGGNQQQNNGLGQTATLGVYTPPPGPDPIPDLGFQSEGGNDGPGLDGPSIFQNPGGDLDGLERKSRELKSKGRTTATVVKSLWPKQQAKWYFRTSKFTTLSQKVAGVSDPVGEQTRSYEVNVLTDDNYVGTFRSVRLPYVIVRSEEPFDRYETQYRKDTFKVYDGEQRLAHRDFNRRFSPAVDLSGAQGQWRDNVFYNESWGNNQGLYREPLGDIDDWCSFDFPPVEGDDAFVPEESTRPGGGDNGPLHQEGSHNWEAYMKFDDYGYATFKHETRYGSVKPFGRNAYQRRFSTPFSASNQYDYERPTVEFVQWGPNGQGLEGSGVSNNRARLTNAMIDAVQPIDIQGGIGELAGEEPNQGIQFAVVDAKVALIDFTEWLTFQDYVALRQVLANGIDDLRDQFGPDGSVFPEHVINDCNTNGQGDPQDLGDLTDYQLAGDRKFYHFYYRQIRSYLHKPEGSSWAGASYFPYPVRPAGQYRFMIEGQPINFQLPQVNIQHKDKQ